MIVEDGEWRREAWKWSKWSSRKDGWLERGSVVIRVALTVLMAWRTSIGFA